ncbi:MAG: 3-phosphoshikimate 1-carboxyvinyltransferase [Longimicrobiales bacterium]
MGERDVSAARSVRVPGDKSLTHRALIFSALAEGRSTLANLQAGEDAQATARVLRALGCAIPPLSGNGSTLVIEGRGLHGLAAATAALDCANSGTTARLMLGVLAGLPFRSVLTGDASLRSRPMRRVTDPLSRMGARFAELEREDCLPIAIEGGPLRGIDFESPRASAQVKSALLLAGLTGGAPVVVREPVLSRDHTERMLSAMGVGVRTTRDPQDGVVIELEPADALRALQFSIPGDISAASFFLALGLLSAHPVRVHDVGLNPGRIGLLSVLNRMGARIATSRQRDDSGEPVGDVIAEPSRLVGAFVSEEELPSLIDEVPILAVIAARAEGETTIRGASELRLKESDRLAALAANLRAVGVEAEELADGLVVQGSDRPLEGRVRSHGDHRIAMAFGVLGALAGNEISIDDPSVAAVSFPGFWEQLRMCSATSAR